MRPSNLKTLRHSLACSTFWAGAVLCVPAAAMAASKTPLDYKAPPPGKNIALKLSQDFSYDTNPLKLVNGAETLRGTVTTGSMLINNATDTSLLQLNSLVSRGVYNNSQFDSTNAHEIVTLARKNQRWNASLDGRFDYDTTRTTEISSFGITSPDVRNVKLAASPEIGFRVTPRNTLGLRATVMDSRYDNRSFIDYRVYEVNPSIRHKIDPKNTAVLRVNAQRYQTQEGVRTTTDSLGPTLGWIWEYDDNLTARFDAGSQRSTQSRAGSTRTTSQNNYVYTGNLNYHYESTITEFTASRAQRPTGNGISTLLTSLDLKEMYLVNDLLSLRGGAGYKKASYLGTPGINLDTEFSGNGAIAYRIFDELDATARYDYVHQKLTSGNGTLDSHSVMLGVSYHPAEFTF